MIFSISSIEAIMQHHKATLFVFISLCLILSANTLANTLPTYQFYIHSLTPTSMRVATRSDELAGALGEGWSSDNDAPVGQCLLGTMDYVGTPSASLSLDVLYRYEDVLNQLNFSVDGSFTCAGFQAKAATNYSHMLEDTAYTQTFIYRATIFLKNRHFVPPVDKLPLTWIGQQYAQDPVAFRANCGDKFIYEQQIGGVLYVAVKFKFRTAQEKLDFDASIEFAVGSLAKLSENLYKAASSIRKNGNVSVTAFQIGGDPTKLGEILNAKSGSSVVSVLNCSLNNLNACHEAIDQILKYATESTSGDFPAQFKTDDPQSLVGPGVIKNILQNMTTVVPVKIGPSLVTQAIVDARAKLSKDYQIALTQTNEVNGLLASHVPLSWDYTQKLNTLKTNVSNNNAILRHAGQACYMGDLSQCLSQKALAEHKLLPINISPFEKRFSVIGSHQYFLLPYSQNQFIFSVLGKYQPGEIYSIKILTNSKIYFENPTKYFLATSTDNGLSYRGLYHNKSTRYLEHMTFIPDFKINEYPPVY